MYRIPVTSKNIKTIAFDELNNKLEIEFHNDSIYHFIPFYPNQWNEFKDSESKGKWFNKYIKPSKMIRHTRIK